ncbi:Innexin inx1 [Sarcoptes scabiei]|uniref:Innexin n=1 Tax=Sarcoptes scabiei TaxID=52283 RepID=A0A834VHS6_SARSC|nr:Innexin inx1 [Sarcoptes scabiei]
MIVSDNRSYESFEKNFIGLEPYNQSYYPRLFLILGFLWSIISINNFLSEQINNFRLRSLKQSIHQKSNENSLKFEPFLVLSWSKSFQIFFEPELIILIGITLKANILNYYFQRKFLTYGFLVLQYLCSDQSNESNPFTFVFPILSKCSIKLWGVSGTLINYDGQCILNFNFINCFTFTFIWFWYFVLFIGAIFSLLKKLTLLSSKHQRSKRIESALIQIGEDKSTNLILLKKMQRKSIDFRTFVTINYIIEHLEKSNAILVVKKIISLEQQEYETNESKNNNICETIF